LTRLELESKIKRFVPTGTEKYIVELLVIYKIQLKLNKPRTSKYGDYRSPLRHDNKHRITVNKDLNPYAFLTTFLHEVAHLTAYEKYKNSIQAHGKEWKNDFKILLHQFLTNHELPDDIEYALKDYMNDPSASSCSDKNLMKVLARYDEHKKSFLEQIPEGVFFKLETGRIFRKGKKLRTWYQCFEHPSNREFRISGISKVELVENTIG
jgi:SprT protein